MKKILEKIEKLPVEAHVLMVAISGYIAFILWVQVICFFGTK